MERTRPDLPAASTTDADSDVVGALDVVDGEPAFIVADIARDDAWLAVPADAALDLDVWT